MTNKKLILSLLCLVLAGEVFANQTIKPTAELVGYWKGLAKVPDTWFGRVDLVVLMAIDGNGVVDGVIGDAELYDGVLKESKIAWIGKQRLWGSEYVVEGKLRGAINAEADIKRKTVRVLFDYDETEDRLEGGVFSNGWIFGAKKTGQVIGRHMELKRTAPNDATSIISKIKENNKAKMRIGIYDSRAVAVAYIHSEQFKKIMQAKMAEMKKAKTAGDEEKIKELDNWGETQQAKVHRQGFSTAPVDDILEHIEDNLPQIAEDANVITLVSKWDKKTLKQYKSAELVDVTDMIVAPFDPSEKVLKTIEQLKEEKPMPLWQLDLMMKFENH